MKHQKIIILLLLLFVGTASAVPTTINDRSEYSRSLNSIASVIMNWYGRLIDDKSDENILFDDIPIDNKWSEYRLNYPKNIFQVFITGTKLRKLNESYQFEVNSKINFSNQGKNQTKIMRETFVFNLSHLHLPTINSAIVNSENEEKYLNSSGYGSNHYKVREFTYAWLSFLDGLDSLNSVMHLENWLNKATYSLTIGAEQITGSIGEVLQRRGQTLSKGGHLLRSLTIKKSQTNDNFVLDLILEWKGVNNAGKSVVAQIHQELEIHIKKDNSWEVMSIKEKHLLPIIAPWMGLLC